MSNGGTHLPYTEAGPYCFGRACKAATLGCATGGYLSDPEKIIMKLRENWAYASAQHLRRVLEGLGGENAHLVNGADESLGRRDICRAFDKVPHAHTAGTPTPFMLNGKLQAGSLFAGGVVALRDPGVFPRDCLLIPVH